MNRNTTRFASTLAITVALAAVGCGSSQTAEDQSAANAGTGSAQGNGGRSTSGGEDLANGGNCSIDSVYFAYDSSELDGSARNTLQQDATCMNRRQGQARVTGMTDPRGTEEYNLALGDRRARTVTGYLSNLGVESGRLSVRSVGEEFAAGEDEAAWARDRRAQIEAQ